MWKLITAVLFRGVAPFVIAMAVMFGSPALAITSTDATVCEQPLEDVRSNMVGPTITLTGDALERFAKVIARMLGMEKPDFVRTIIIFDPRVPEASGFPMVRGNSFGANDCFVGTLLFARDAILEALKAALGKGT